MNGDSQHTTSYTTMAEYLRGCVGFRVPDDAIRSILIDREVAEEENVVELDKRLRELCKADLYMWCASTPSVTGSVEDANGVWRHKDGGTQSSAFDKRNLRAMANDIYRKYGENVRQSRIRILSFGMRASREDVYGN